MVFCIVESFFVVPFFLLHRRLYLGNPLCIVEKSRPSPLEESAFQPCTHREAAAEHKPLRSEDRGVPSNSSAPRRSAKEAHPLSGFCLVWFAWGGCSDPSSLDTVLDARFI